MLTRSNGRLAREKQPAEGSTLPKFGILIAPKAPVLSLTETLAGNKDSHRSLLTPDISLFGMVLDHLIRSSQWKRSKRPESCAWR